jgi:dipeptidyl aminopeptidase/acylaminoacyl peptidase
LTHGGDSHDDRHPSWSPDGDRIAYDGLGPFGSPASSDIYVVNRDGSDAHHLTNTPNPTYEDDPAWSPDGRKIAFRLNYPSGVHVMNADGSGQVRVTSSGVLPDWQPVQSYARPKSATPLTIALVPAYFACISPNAAHGGPLETASCSPPAQNSSTLTIGTPDANGSSARFRGSVRYKALPGDPSTQEDEADVSIQLSLTDVRCQATTAACPLGPGSDYVGKLLATQSSLRITDRDNGAGSYAGTTQDTSFPIPFDCVSTLETDTGSSCNLTTTADTVVAGFVKEGKRAIWQLGSISIRDAGADGTGYDSGCPPTCGDGDERLFLRQGLFVP